MNSSRAGGRGIFPSVIPGHCLMSSEQWHSRLSPTANSLYLNLVPSPPILGALIHTVRCKSLSRFHLFHRCWNTSQSPVLSLLLPSSDRYTTMSARVSKIWLIIECIVTFILYLFVYCGHFVPLLPHYCFEKCDLLLNTAMRTFSKLPPNNACLILHKCHSNQQGKAFRNTFRCACSHKVNRLST